MSCEDSNNAVYVSSIDNLGKEEDRFGMEENPENDNLKFLQPHTNSSLPSVEQFEAPPVPKLMQYFSQMSIDDQQKEYRKQMSIELMSPMKLTTPLKKQEPQTHTFEIKEIENSESREEEKIRTRRIKEKKNYNVDDSPDEEEEFRPCHCSKTHCLQLYCSCFHNRRPCSSECKCNDCYNDGKHEDEVIKAVEQIKVKEQRASHHDLDSFDTKQIWGCKCKKTKCVKGYCECFIRGKKCTSHCQCTECENKRQPKQQINKKIKKKKS